MVSAADPTVVELGGASRQRTPRRRRRSPASFSTAWSILTATYSLAHHLRQNRLYRGEAGVCVLTADLADPANARMPMFEPV